MEAAAQVGASVRMQHLKQTTPTKTREPVPHWRYYRKYERRIKKLLRFGRQTAPFLYFTSSDWAILSYFGIMEKKIKTTGITGVI